MKWLPGMLTLVLLSSAASAQTASPKGSPQPAADRAAIEKALIAAEQRIDDAVIKGDLATFKSIAADDIMSLTGGGSITMTEIAPALKPGMSHVTDVKRDNFKVRWVDADTAIVVYAQTGKGTLMNTPVLPTYRSTVFTRRGDKWQAVFHQESVQAPAPAASSR